ncbi:MAG: PilZ domain-containing protein [Candidatus Omnitrophica bacterium]|nr:PilZ domain-containing protein [Candidatus Omnitrophota bacterium]
MKKKSSNGSEKRRYLRFEDQAGLKILVKKKGKNRYSRKKIKAILKNLSAEGISFLVEEKLNKGDLLKIELCFGTSKSLHLEGRVAWGHPDKETKDTYLIGAKLFTLDKSDETKFLRYISDRMTQRLSRYLHL